MSGEQQLKLEIKKRIDHIPAERLSDVLEFIKQIEIPKKETIEILAFAGSLKDLDKEVFEDLTIHLHENRLLQSRSLPE